MKTVTWNSVVLNKHQKVEEQKAELKPLFNGKVVFLMRVKLTQEITNWIFYAFIITLP